MIATHHMQALIILKGHQKPQNFNKKEGRMFPGLNTKKCPGKVGTASKCGSDSLTLPETRLPYVIQIKQPISISRWSNQQTDDHTPYVINSHPERSS